MTFEQLYNHMDKYIEIPEERWKLVTRVKRGISDPHQIGCYARDQSYFEGAVDILENLDTIDFVLLMSGKICLDELDRIKRISRINSIKIPKFMKDLQSYKEKLRHIGIVNGIIEPKESERIKNGKLIIDHRLIPENNSLDNKGDNKSGTPKENSKNVNLELYSLNNQSRNLTSIEIKRFINREIVSHTKSTLENKPNLTDNQKSTDDSSLCILL